MKILKIRFLLTNRLLLIFRKILRNVINTVELVNQISFSLMFSVNDHESHSVLERGHKKVDNFENLSRFSF